MANGKRGRPARPPTTEIGRRVQRLIDESPHLENRAALARKIGMGESNLGKLLKKSTPPSHRVLKDMAQALRCSVADIWPPEDFSNGEAPYKAWREFRATDMGKGMDPTTETRDLAGLRFRHTDPSSDLYTAILLAYRGHGEKRAVKPSSSSRPPPAPAPTRARPSNGGSVPPPAAG